MQLVRETILYRATTTNIGASSTNDDEAVTPGVHNQPDSDVESELETPLNTKENVDIKESSPVLKKKFKDSPIEKKTGTIDRQIDLEILRVLKKDQEKDNSNVENKPVAGLQLMKILHMQIISQQHWVSLMPIINRWLK